tara:strand:- start:10622 stop:10885 length:264 start_codon:yes stop_codon:yes gene_type:complete
LYKLLIGLGRGGFFAFVPELVASLASSSDVVRSVFAAFAPGLKVLSCTLELLGLGQGDPVLCCESFCGILPHEEATVAAVAILVLES